MSMTAFGLSLTEQRLRVGITVFFFALILPALLLAYRAYDQTQWEVFHRHRLQAEELSARIDRGLADAVAVEDARSFGDYAFLIIDEHAEPPQRSPLSTLPVHATLPGLLGYFQVDSAGRFSTPLVPATSSDHRRHGLSNAEYANRVALGDKLRAILTGSGSIAVGRRDKARPALKPAADADRSIGTSSASSTIASGNVFERLTRATESRQHKQKASAYGNVADLKLDQRLEKRSLAQSYDAPSTVQREASAKRAPRREQIALLEAEAPMDAFVASDDLAEDELVADLLVMPSLAMKDEIARLPAAAALAPGLKPKLRVRLFEGELDAMNLQALDATHFVLFRNVWRAGTRYIQGAVIERSPFLNALIEGAWQGSALSDMSNLLVAWEGEVLAFKGADASAYLPRADALRGELLYRTRLSAPMAALELVYSVTELPLGPSVAYLAWVTLILVLVLAGGSYTMYRFGIGQMRLYRQQQDFVSAVSHELKTPLTSIRMYSEMLKAGWADEDRKLTYYTFIHDESERLSRLIGNVLQLSRMTRGQTAVELKPVTVEALFARIEGKLASQLARAGFELKQQIAADVAQATIAVDEDAVTQILINLVDNAVKFVPASALQRIDIDCRRMGSTDVRITVRDYGQGVPKDQMRRIFELFFRAENELTRETVGTGIGLALVRQLAGAMNGTVDVTNRDPGAEFSLSLPLVKC